MLTQEIARSVWNYDQQSGYFLWKISPRYKVQVGDRAGSLDSGTGYWRLRYQGKSYKASRMAWFYMTGTWPNDQIDHINGDKLDDSFRNLREATNSENCRNRGLRKDNKLKTKGVYWRKGGFIAQVVAGNLHTSKMCKTLEEAKLFYEAESLRLHGDFARAN